MRQILQPGLNCWGIQSVRETGLLIDGRDYYRAFYHAAKKAQRYIAISGWQFDSTVRLLRGEDLNEAAGEVSFLPFLNDLCQGNPELRVYILAWGFRMLYAFEREWGQEWIFNRTADRLQFRFDNCHPLTASHHQKFVVVDSQIAFVGGEDICERRWDDRDHRAVHPDRRDTKGEGYGPYHEIQSYHTGAVAQQLAELFALRWRQCGGGEISLPPPSHARPVTARFGMAIATDRVAVSRTFPAMRLPPQDTIYEIRHLYLDAIAAAERLIYIENQYFSSEAICKAVVERMQTATRPRLQIIMILPKRPEAFLEQVALGLPQATMLRSLTATARDTGHALGIYYSATTGVDGQELATYIHAKLLLVDDRFLSIGSANTTNRSLGLDTELNTSWEATSWRQRRPYPLDSSYPDQFIGGALRDGGAR